MLKNSIDDAVNSAVSSIGFEKVSDLTKEQFSEILSKSIYDAITSRDYFKEISQQLASQARLEMRRTAGRR